jgi:hypothetical protein
MMEPVRLAGQVAIRLLAIAQVGQCMMAVSQSSVATAADLADRPRFQSAGMIRPDRTAEVQTVSADSTAYLVGPE